MKWLLGGSLVTLLALAALALVDVTRTAPPVPPGRCVLQRNLVLPDRCRSSCKSGADCPTASTRPYALFGTQAASCPDAVICG